jgi:hypothetical protein
MLILSLVLVTDLKGQSISIDSSTLSNAQHYLVEGAKARRKVLDYRKLIQLDSIEIAQLDSIRTIQAKTIQHKQVEIDSLKTHENTLKRSVLIVAIVSFVLGILI